MYIKLIAMEAKYFDRSNGHLQILHNDSRKLRSTITLNLISKKDKGCPVTCQTGTEGRQR